MNRTLTTILFAALLTALPLSLVRAESASPVHPAQLSLAGLLDDCAGFEPARVVPAVPDCIVQAITRKLQRQIESEANLTLETWSQERQARTVGDSPASDNPVASAGDQTAIAL